MNTQQVTKWLQELAECGNLTEAQSQQLDKTIEIINQYQD